MPFLAELIKLCISSWLFSRQRHIQPEAARATRRFSTSLLFLVPSVIYWVHNNVQFLTLQHLDPSAYQILGNLKIVTTGVLFWLFLKRRLSLLQWYALVLLTVGATTSQVSSQGQRSTLLSGGLRPHGSRVTLCLLCQ